MEAGLSRSPGRLAIPLGVFMVFALLLGVATQAADAAPKPADTVMRKGFVYTVDKQNSVKQAVAMRNGKIVYVGTNRGVGKFIGKRTKVTNLGGKMVMPGIVDAHNHAIGAGEDLLNCNLNYAGLAMAEFKAEIQACLDRNVQDEGPDSWMVVINWYRQAMTEEPTNLDLDSLTTERPIAVYSSDGHTVLTNSRGLAIAGVTAATPDPEGGRIEHHSGGEPNGVFEDTAGRLVSSQIPPSTASDRIGFVEVALKEAATQGVTSFMQQIASDPTVKAYASVAQDSGLTARVSLAPDLTLDEQRAPNATVKRLRALKRKHDHPLRPQPNTSLHNVGEVFQDGVAQWPAQTASLLQPYLKNVGTEAAPDWQPSNWSGPDPYTPLPVLKKLALALAKAGIEPEIHAIGDRAVRHTLDAYEHVRKQLNRSKAKKAVKKARRSLAKARTTAAKRAAKKRLAKAQKQLKRTDVRLLIAHAEIVDPADYGRFAKLDVVPAMGFWWASPDFDSIDATQDFLGPDRFNREEPHEYLRRAGAKIALGSDWPVNPYDTMYQLKVLTTREGNNPDPKYQGRLGTVPPVPIKPAIRAMTINGAYGMHQEKQTGSLERGKFADLIVLDRNLLKIDPRTIDRTKVLQTVVGGKTVYKRK